MKLVWIVPLTLFLGCSLPNPQSDYPESGSSLDSAAVSQQTGIFKDALKPLTETERPAPELIDIGMLSTDDLEDTAEWLTYIDPDGVFHIDYPHEWSLIGSDDAPECSHLCFAVVTPDDAHPHIQMTYYLDRSMSTLREWCDSTFRPTQQQYCSQETIAHGLDQIIFSTNQHGLEVMQFIPQKNTALPETYFVHTAPYIIQLDEEHYHADVLRTMVQTIEKR